MQQVQDIAMSPGKGVTTRLLWSPCTYARACVWVWLTSL